jgi:hypothetical protein
MPAEDLDLGAGLPQQRDQLPPDRSGSTRHQDPAHVCTPFSIGF